jgi:carbamoyltransferase
MNILSFFFWDGCHDTSAAIVCDGVLIAAAEEERFSRDKHDANLPLRAIDFCLRRAGLSMDQVDAIAFPDMPFRSGVDSQLADTDLRTIRKLNAAGEIRYRSVLHKLALNAAIASGLKFNWSMHPAAAAAFAELRKHYTRIPSVHFYPHHLCHAAATYLTSGFDHAAIATIDGRGANYSAVTWSGRNNIITRLQAEPYTNSLGFFYQDCTEYLGLGRLSKKEFGEGKTMGLAPYGQKINYAKRVSHLLDVTGPRWYQYKALPSEAELGFSPRDGEPILNPPYSDFAAAIQDSLERATVRIAQSALEMANSRALCLAGGVTLNCSSNGKLLGSGLASSIWIFPAAGDSGLSAGAALLCAAEAGTHAPVRLDQVYLGPEFSDRDFEGELEREPKVTFDRPSDLVGAVSQELSNGAVVGWFQGRMEFGPRALGNRSILADPRTIRMRDRVNRIKGRELWRPLSPVVLAQRASEFFTLSTPSPFMLFAVQVRQDKRSLIQAVVHVDGSARPQTVTRKQNYRLYELIDAFSRLSGVPVLLNTSFNAAGEPIVCTPGDALKTFLATGLDLLVLGDFVVKRRS